MKYFKRSKAKALKYYSPENFVFVICTFESHIICQYRNTEENLGFIYKYWKTRILRLGLGLGSYSSLGFRALRKDVDWTLAETAEHLSGH